MIQEEDITFDAHKARKCSFITSRPLLWSKAIEDHTLYMKVDCLEQYKSDNGLYIEYLLAYNDGGERKVTLNIYVKTGVVLVKGEYFQTWAEKVFPVLKACLTNYIQPVDKLERRMKRNSYCDKRLRSRSVENLSCVGLRPALSFKDMGDLWKENLELKKGLVNLEKDYDLIQKDLDVLHKRGYCYEDGKVRRVVEVANGKKVAVYTPVKTITAKLITDDVEVEKRSKVITESAQKLEKQISDMRGRLSKKICEIQSTIKDCPRALCKCSGEFHCYYTSIPSHIASSQQIISGDIESLKKRIDSLDSTFTALTVFNPNSPILKRIEEEQKNIQKNVAAIKESLDEMRKKCIHSWNNYSYLKYTQAQLAKTQTHKKIP